MESAAGLAAAFLEDVGKPLRRDVSLREMSSFRIGGPADLFFEAETGTELAASIGFARRTDVPWYVIGGGYNLLFADEGFRGLIVRNRAQRLAPGPGPGEITVLSGTSLPKMLQYALDEGLEGLEFLAGIPGTVGGALYGNAGAFGRAMADIFVAATCLGDDGTERPMSREDMGFGYRHSALKTRPAVLMSAVLRTPPGDPEAIRKRVRENDGVPPGEAARLGNAYAREATSRIPSSRTARRSRPVAFSRRPGPRSSAWAMPPFSRGTRISSSIWAGRGRPTSLPWPRSSRRG